jgi:hypothetical protein
MDGPKSSRNDRVPILKKSRWNIEAAIAAAGFEDFFKIFQDFPR